MTTKHTPGPWSVGRAGWTDDGNVWYELEGIKKGCAADARLIAAAPDLLEGLQALDALRGPFSPTDDQIIEAWGKARAAIAKATGEQQ